MSTDMAVTCRLPLVSDRAAKVTPHKDGQTPESTSSSKGHTNREIWIFFRIVNLIKYSLFGSVVDAVELKAG